MRTNQWSSSPITTPYCWFAMTVLDDKLVIAGDRTNNDEIVKKVSVLNTGQWKDYSEMLTARCRATAVGYHSKLIVVGGAIKVESKWFPVPTTELLDTINGCWYSCNDLPSPHMQAKAVILNCKLYLLGGKGKNGLSSQAFVSSLNNLTSYQLKWQSVPNTPWCYSSPVVQHNYLLIVGGRQPFDVISQTCELYALHPSTNQWKYLSNIPAARSLPAVVSMDDKMIVLGGMTNTDTEFSKTVWIGGFE